MPDKIYNQEYVETFRDRTATYDDQGKRKWIYPQKPKGRFHIYRLIVGYILIAFFLVAPFIEYNNKPMLMFNFLERKFSIFFVIFHPQDSYIFFFMMISLIVFIILFTVVYGRIWCGWACPQTVFMELVFRKIEYIIEGNAEKQIKLNKQVWNVKKIIKKTTKYTLFYLISFVIANSGLTYLIGADEWLHHVTNISMYKNSLFTVLIFAAVIYLIYAFIREQLCLVVCPYGRLQGIFTDANTITVAYDYNRGEPRKDINTDTKNGDCIDCKQCIKVCPTGIDIRNGTQLECINCTACIDACNHIMMKMKKPGYLVRLTSENAIRTGKINVFTPRTIAYTVVLAALSTMLFILLITRSEIETTVLHTPGTSYQETEDERIGNLYNVKVVNKTGKDKTITLELINIDGEINYIGGDINVDANDVGETVVFIYIPKDKILNKKTPIEIGVYANNKKIEIVNTTFVAP